MFTPLKKLSSDRGASMVEFGLLLPILVLLLFGIIEFGRGYNAHITLTHAAREGVRTLAITKDAGLAAARTREAATSLDPALIGVTTTACVSGDPTNLTATYPFAYDIPLFGTGTVTITAQGVMRCGG